MSVSIIVVPIMILLMLVCISIPVMLGVFVYRDAKARGMEPLLWALIAVLAPSFIGLIIYLVVRKDHIVLNCPRCGGEVQEYFTTCPGCGQKLKAGCPNCGTALRPEWKICPQCGREITETEGFTPPVIDKSKKNNGLTAVIIAIIAVPLIVLLLVIFGLMGFLGVNRVVNSSDDYDYNTAELMEEFNSSVGVTSLELITVEDAGNALSDVDKNWIAECKKGEDGIYSKTIYQHESGGFVDADSDSSDDVGKGEYELTYAYTIIVVNSPDGKACTASKGEAGIIEYSTNSILPERIEFNLEEAENGDDYNNVFIIKSLHDYYISINNDNGVTAVAENSAMEIDNIEVTIFDKDSSINYKVPIQENPVYIEFAKAAAK
ncbi:MAG: zinc ribbon domain-containing protein [Acutalibacteraceae bacterium]